MNVLFVHGMGRTPLSGWFLLRKLKERGFSTYTFGYSTTTHDFAQISDRLTARIAELARAGDYLLIGHSLGGLLLRAALASLPPDTPLPLCVFLLGSPVRSARLARRLRHNLVFRAITRDCGQLLASDERKRGIAPPPVPTTAIYGTRALRLTACAFGDEPNDGVVAISETSASWIDDEVHVPVVHSFLPASGLVAEHILGTITAQLSERAPRPERHYLKPAGEDLANRRPVWAALSDMYLDTDVSLSRDWRIRVLAASPYSLDELEAILVDEIRPICSGNLRCVAGEWAGFDEAWLEERILARAASPRRPGLPRFLPRVLPRMLGRLADPASPEWELMRSAIVATRAAPRAPYNMT